ncbi:MAG: type II toxin-antitoxin system HicA family toxin [Chloroflexi bacterium]|nr:type II toxin-antitoxin system HicA family toxin [Chloroflexota bacterium]MBM4452813.1 type II toxin-antitoxin system HicA family toxin [Chloroflexota bacterium]MBM4454718.1 type II toxin-antitoxin system HicA family toxin [Chloroflexota bacterium]
MKLPRDVGGEKLASLLTRYGYRETHRTGSHIRLTTTLKGTEHRLTIPAHDPVKVGTLNNIMNDLASYLEKDKQALIRELFG